MADSFLDGVSGVGGKLAALVTGVLLALTWSGAAHAQSDADQLLVYDVPRYVAQAEPSSGQEGLWGVISEIRGGVLAHDVALFGSHKESGADINGEILFVSPEFLSILWSPRPHIGADINTQGDTSQFYIGATWDYEPIEWLFVEGFLGGAVHDGKLKNGGPNRKDLGCRALFRLGGSLGVRFAEHSISVMYDHISNASLCSENEGLNNIGVRYGYRF